MKSLLVLLLALVINTNVMAQEPATPAPTLPTGGSMPPPPEGPNSADDKALVDQKHKAESGSLDQHAGKKKMQKDKKKHSKKNHGASKKHRKNKKSRT